jgi:hypothetical protein
MSAPIAPPSPTHHANTPAATPVSTAVVRASQLRTELSVTASATRSSWSPHFKIYLDETGLLVRGVQRTTKHLSFSISEKLSSTRVSRPSILFYFNLSPSRRSDETQSHTLEVVGYVWGATSLQGRLFVTQRHHRVDVHCRSCRNQSGRQRHNHQ